MKAILPKIRVLRHFGFLRVFGKFNLQGRSKGGPVIVVEEKALFENPIFLSFGVNVPRIPETIFLLGVGLFLPSITMVLFLLGRKNSARIFFIFFFGDSTLFGQKNNVF